MIKTPNFLKKLMQSDAYSNKSNPDYENANEEVSKYLNIFYPGKMEFDATGRMKEPEFDMTLEQFENAQNQIDADFEEAKEEAAEEIMEEFGEYFENLGIDFDIEQYVIPAETMVVNVLHPDGEILTKDLEFYDLEIPDFEKANKIWTWHSEQSESTCDECAKLDGQVFFDESELPECPVHENCKCWIEESEIDENGNKIKSKKYNADINKDETMNPKEMKLSEKGINWLKNLEGAIKVDGQHVIYDDKTKLPVKENEPLPEGATIGYGHLIQRNENFRAGLSEKEATELFKKDLKTTYSIIEKQINADTIYKITQNQYDALVSLVFNIGPGDARTDNINKGLYQSTVRKYLNDNSNYVSKTYPTLKHAWYAFSNGRLLNNRRNAEWRLFQNADYSGYK